MYFFKYKLETEKKIIKEKSKEPQIDIPKVQRKTQKKLKFRF